MRATKSPAAAAVREGGLCAVVAANSFALNKAAAPMFVVPASGDL
jgi:hypothetical protein